MSILAKERPSALVVWGGWPGHEPEKCVDIFAPWLRKRGFEVTVSDTIDSYLNEEMMGSYDVVVPVYTQGEITGEQSQLPLHGLFFVDAGNTWESGDDTEATDLYWGAGAGLRVEVPVLGNLGVDLGYGFDEEKGQDWIVHYQFGMEF